RIPAGAGQVVPEQAPVGQLLLLGVVFLLVGGGDHGAELLVDKIALGTEFLVEFIPTRKAQNMGDASPTELVFGQILALPIIVTLNGMFDVAQEAVGFRQLPIDARWQAVELLQA